MNNIMTLVEYLFDSSRPIRCEYCEHYDYCFKSGSSETLHACEAKPKWSDEMKQKFLEIIQYELDTMNETDCKPRTIAEIIAESCKNSGIS